MAEVLSPCGSYETLEAVLKTGTDAVYLGSARFSARAGAHNFDRQELARAVYECHRRGVKLYQAINTVITDDEIPALTDELHYACSIGVDGIITQDLALVKTVRECCPELPIHASTQMTVHTKNGVLEAARLGFCRAVLARELPIDIIKRLAALGIETEVFVHGALCMSVSGQCYMSAVIGRRSANRGMCAQACRLPASPVRGSERYDLSLKDMSYIPHLKELEEAGVSSLKIEGRMKRPEYSAAAADACNRSLKGEEYDMGLLSDIFSRDGFTEGYYSRAMGRGMFGTRTKENVKASAEAMSSIHKLYRYEHKYTALSFTVYARAGEALRLTAADREGNSVTVTGNILEKASNRAADKEYIERQLSKLGDTIYDFGGASADIAGEPAVSASALNTLRREACSRLDKIRAEVNTKQYKFLPLKYVPVRERHRGAQRLRLIVSDASQLSLVAPEDYELAFVPAEQAEKSLGMGIPAQKLGVAADRFTFDEEGLIKRLRAARELGINALLATNIAHIRIGRSLGMEVHADFGLNVTNTLSAEVLKEMGAKDINLSFELKLTTLSRIGGDIPKGVFAYGRLPLMLCANCPLRQSKGCKDCKRELYDRTGRAFRIKCSKEKGYVEILNSDILIMSDKKDDMGFADYLSLYFSDETPKRVLQVTDAYKTGRALNEKNMTRGLYYRGII